MSLNPTDRADARVRLGFSPEVPDKGSGPPRATKDSFGVSVSKLKLYEECAQRYNGKHILKLPDVSTGAMWRGIAVHRANERMARDYLVHDVQHDPKEVFKACAGSLRPRDFAEAEEIFLDSVDGLPALGNCLGVEENFSWRLTEAAEGRPPIVLVGSLDRIDIIELPRTAFDEGGKFWHIYDYKSGDSMLSYDQAEDDLQVGAYMAFVHARTGSTKIRMTLLYVAKERRVTVAWTPALQAATESRLRELSLRLQADKEWKPTLGSHCVTCPYQGGCDDYKKALRSTDSVLTVAAHGDAELLTERQRCSKLAKIFEAHRKACDEIIGKRLVDRPEIFGGGLRAKRITKNMSKPAALSTTVEALAPLVGAEPQQMLSEICGVDQRRLKDYLARFPADVRKQTSEKLDELREHYDVSSYIDVRDFKSPF